MAGGIRRRAGERAERGSVPWRLNRRRGGGISGHSGEIDDDDAKLERKARVKLPRGTVRAMSAGCGTIGRENATSRVRGRNFLLHGKKQLFFGPGFIRNVLEMLLGNKKYVRYAGKVRSIYDMNSLDPEKSGRPGPPDKRWLGRYILV